MTDTPEMAEWLKRIILAHGEKQVVKGLMSLGNARQLLYGDLNYDITRKQFEGLREARENMPVESGMIVKREYVNHKVYREGKPTGQVHQQVVYRDILGRFSRH